MPENAPPTTTETALTERGRVLSAANETQLRTAIAAHRTALDALETVLGALPEIALPAEATVDEAGTTPLDIEYTPLIEVADGGDA